ncbi:putative membrane protein YeaQ/YmgE (transglycosylase-associated protein family) [Novosphingobium sp. SG916]|nr:putative membrane protein YeaQ/YmgE (transglycosylase-associated protein family) [Novosphingobium sp. SG919]NMN85452.1 putative membrane protein YeaQ/YmgE (transglycosylase-associated protein family) [Novosphingobium sp. SG916]
MSLGATRQRSHDLIVASARIYIFCAVNTLRNIAAFYLFLQGDLKQEHRNLPGVHLGYHRDQAKWPDRLEKRRRTIMGIIMWLVVGGVIGWLASVIMRTDGQQGIVLNIVVGIVGSFLGGLILARGDINDAPLTVTTFLVSLAGAVVLLAIVNLFRRGSIR